MSELELPDPRHFAVAGSGRAAGRGRVVRPKRQRTCVGCRRSCGRQDLVRLVGAANGTINFDLMGAAPGRGAWVHPRPECLAKSTRGIQRALRQPITVRPGELDESLVNAAWRRAGRLMSAALRAGQLRIGAEAAERCRVEGSLALLLVARDVCPAAIPSWVAEAGVKGRVLVTPSKAAMGEWLGTQEVDLAAITESRLAIAIARDVAIAETFASVRTSRGSDKGTEVG